MHAELSCRYIAYVAAAVPVSSPQIMHLCCKISASKKLSIKACSYTAEK